MYSRRFRVKRIGSKLPLLARLSLLCTRGRWLQTTTYIKSSVFFDSKKYDRATRPFTTPALPPLRAFESCTFRCHRDA